MFDVNLMTIWCQLDDGHLGPWIIQEHHKNMCRWVFGVSGWLYRPTKVSPESSGEQNEIRLGFCLIQVEERRCMLSKLYTLPKTYSYSSHLKMDAWNTYTVVSFWSKKSIFRCFFCQFQGGYIDHKIRRFWGSWPWSVRCMDTATRWAMTGGWTTYPTVASVTT